MNTKSHTRVTTRSLALTRKPRRTASFVVLRGMLRWMLLVPLLPGLAWILVPQDAQLTKQLFNGFYLGASRSKMQPACAGEGVVCVPKCDLYILASGSNNEVHELVEHHFTCL